MRSRHMLGTSSSRLLGLLSLAALAACVSGTRARGSGRSDELARSEVVATGATNAYDVVAQLRPRWLRVRASRSLNMGTQILVYVDNMRLGGVESLRSIPIESIEMIQWLDAAQAVARLPGIGSEHVAGAIVVRARAGPASTSLR